MKWLTYPLLATIPIFAQGADGPQPCALEPGVSLGLLQAQVPNPLGSKTEKVPIRWERRMVQPEIQTPFGLKIPAVYADVPVEWKTVTNDVTAFIKPTFSFTEEEVSGKPGIRVNEVGEFGFISPMLDELVSYIRDTTRAAASESCENSIDGVSAGIGQITPPTIWSKVDATARVCANVPTTCGVEIKCDLIGCGPRPKICNTVAKQDIASGKLDVAWQINAAVEDTRQHVRFTITQSTPPTVTVGGGTIYDLMSRLGIIRNLESIGVLPNVSNGLNQTAVAVFELARVPLPDSNYIYKPMLLPGVEWINKAGDGGQAYRLKYHRTWVQRQDTVCPVIECLRKSENATTFPNCES